MPTISVLFFWIKDGFGDHRRPWFYFPTVKVTCIHCLIFEPHHDMYARPDLFCIQNFDIVGEAVNFESKPLCSKPILIAGFR
jgi:hypothetical protein